MSPEPKISASSRGDDGAISSTAISASTSSISTSMPIGVVRAEPALELVQLPVDPAHVAPLRALGTITTSSASPAPATTSAEVVVGPLRARAC